MDYRGCEGKVRLSSPVDLMISYISVFFDVLKAIPSDARRTTTHFQASASVTASSWLLAKSYLEFSTVFGPITIHAVSQTQ